MSKQAPKTVAPAATKQAPKTAASKPQAPAKVKVPAAHKTPVAAPVAGPKAPSAELLAKVNAAARKAFESLATRDVTGIRAGTRARIVNAAVFAFNGTFRTAEICRLCECRTYDDAGVQKHVGAVANHLRWLASRGMIEQAEGGGWQVSKAARKLMGK